MSSIVGRQPQGCKTIVYYYHYAYRVKINPEDQGKTGPGSGPSKVVTKDIYLGTADQILEKIQQGSVPKEVAQKSFGLECAVISVLKELSIINIINKFVPKRNQGMSVGYYIALGVLARICAPEVSYNTFSQWVRKTVIPEKLGIDLSLVDSDNFWDNFDLILPEENIPKPKEGNKPQDILDDKIIMDIEGEIWNQIYKLCDIPLDVLLYDTTNYYTFFDPLNTLNLAAYGKNKAGRNNLLQVGLALAVTREGGLPWLHMLYRGCRHDSKIFNKSITAMVNRIAGFNKASKKITIVFDKGNNSKKNIQNLSKEIELNEEENIRLYAVGSLVPSYYPELLNIKLKNFNSLDENKVYLLEQEIFDLPCKVVIMYSDKSKRKQRLNFRKKLIKLVKNLEECFQTKYEKGKAKNEINSALKKIMGNKSEAACLNVELTGRRYKKLSISLNRKKTKEKLKRMGRRLLFSTDTSLNTKEIVAIYDKDKVKIEDTFRLSKCPDIIRFEPVRCWTDSKLRIYAFICVLSMLVIKLLVFKADKAGLHMSPNVICTELKDIHEAILLYSPKKAVRMITKMSTIQKELFDLYGLKEYEPKQ